LSRVGRLAGGLIIFALAAGSGGLLPSCSSTPEPDPSAPATTAPATPETAPPLDAAAPVDAPSPPVVDAAKACGATGLLDVEVRRDGRYRGVQLSSPEASVRLVDACQGAGAPVRGAGTLRFIPTIGAAFYAVVEPVTPGYYPSATELWTFEYPGLRGDYVVHLISQGGLDPQVTGSPIADPFAGVFNPSKAHFVIDLVPVGSCGTDGYRLTVVGHPEAKIAYSSGRFAPDPTLEESSTEAQTFAFISGVNPGPGTLEVTGSRGGCRVAPPTLLVPVNSGKYPLIAGTVTHVELVSTAE
jgi:hypothetical protein